jgi:F0F1-type ATP synthase assembly protein I
MRGTAIGLGLFFRLSAITLGAAFGSLLLGIWIDRMLGTAPICTLILMVIGILVGTIGVYRTVKEANEEIAKAGERTNTKGGD